MKSVLANSTLVFFSGADGLGLEIENLVDISSTHNFELVMRLSTNINSTNEFFTDLNGFQVRIFKKHNTPSYIYFFRYYVENALKSYLYKQITIPCRQQHTWKIKIPD